MAVKEDLLAEWDDEHASYRLFHGADPAETIAYANNLMEAERVAVDRGENIVLYDNQVSAKPLQRENKDFNKHRLYVDMDGTLAEFKIVTYQEQLFEKGYFANLKPQENVVEAIRSIIKDDADIEVFILSAYLTDSQYALDEKNEWLDRYLPEIGQEHRMFVPCGTDKKEAIENLSQRDFLLDDYTVNLLDWVPPGKAIKLINNINHTRGTWKEDCIRFDRTSEDISGLIVDVVRGDTRAFDTKESFDSNHPSGNDPREAESFERNRGIRKR